MLPTVNTPLIALSNLFADRSVYAKCEHLVPAGSFKIHGAKHLLDHLGRQDGPRLLVVPSMGNTALGAAAGARRYNFAMIGVVPTTISPAKDEKLASLGVELVKLPCGGSELLVRAKEIAAERGGYFAHPHLDRLWTDGYQVIAEQILTGLPECRSLVIPVGGGGLLMGLTEYLMRRRAGVKVYGCEPWNYPTYARFEHARSATIADGLMLDQPHAVVRQRIDELGIGIHLVSEEDISEAMQDLYEKQGLVVEPSSAITVAFVRRHRGELEEPIAVVLTGGNIVRADG
jgi:threonine dehydratase